MIKVEAINGSPSSTPTFFVGSHFDGEYFYFFESEEEKVDFYASINTWSKEAHLAEIDALHEAEFDRRWRAADYVGRWEVAAAANDENNPYNDEAKSIMAYWWNGWAAIKYYGDTLSEQPTETPEEFFTQLNSTL